MIIYESKIGDSLSIGFLFNEAFDMSRLESVNVCLGSRIYPHTIIDQMIRCELKSEDTNKLNGTLKLTLEIDDSVLGKKKREIGEVKFNVSNSQGNNESVNTGYDVVVPITINEQHITTGDVLYNYVKGENGDVTADNIDLAIAEGYSEEGSILDEDLIIGQDKKKWTFLSIFDVIKSKLGISVGGVATKFLNQLGEFVNIVIGGSVQSQLYYMDSSSDITPLYKRLDYIPYAEESEISHSLTTTEQLLATFIYDSPIATDTIDAGTWYSTVIGKVSSAAGETTIRLEFFMRSSAGVETVLFSKTSDEINNTDYSEIKGNAVNGAFVVDAESNLGVKIYGVTTGSNKTIYFKTGGQNLSYLQIPLKMRHENLRGLNNDPNYQHLTTTELNQVKYLDLTSEKTTPIAADSLGLWDSVTSTLKKLSLTNLITFLSGTFATLTQLATKQNTLVSGSNIRTVNGNSLLGSSDLVLTTTGATVVGNFGSSETSVIHQKSVSSILSYYVIANKVGYIRKTDGAFVIGEYGARYSDFYVVNIGDEIILSTSLTIGTAGEFINCFNSNKVWIKSVSTLSVVDFDGYVVFQAQTASITEKSFSVVKNIKRHLDPISESIATLNSDVNTLKPDNTNLLISSIGGWVANFGSTVTFDSTYKSAKVVTANTNYSGMQLNKTLDLIQYVCEFEAKTTGNINEWALTSSNLVTISTELFYPEKKWKKFRVIIAACDSSHRKFTFYQRRNEVQTLLVRNFRYSKLNTVDHANFNNDIDIQKNKVSIDGNGSVSALIIDRLVSDVNCPDWVGKSCVRITDLIPSIETQGQSYLFNNGGVIELRVVKDSQTIVGCELTTKYSRNITPVTRSIVFLGDSRTVGVGTTTGNSYPEKTRDLLVSDGHTISKFTVTAQNGADPIALKNYIAGLATNNHDIAVLMIGTAILDSWMTNNSLPDENGSCLPADFRTKYRNDLSSLISTIKAYCSYSKLFLVVETPMLLVSPDKPTVLRYNAKPLYDIIIQETLYYYENNKDATIICRGDYYLRNPTLLDLPDYIHPSDSGALKLAQGVRNEMTFLM